MHKLGLIVLAYALSTAGLAWGQTTNSRQPARSLAQATTLAGVAPLTSISSFTVNGSTSPSAITFAANSPGGTIAGSGTALLDMYVPNQNHNSWSITVQAAGSTMNCGTAAQVPMSAITVSCSGAYMPSHHSGINPMEAEMGSSTTVAARYTIRVPKETAEGSYYCAAGFTTLPVVSPQLGGTGMRMAVRAVAAFYVVVGNTQIEGGLKEFKLERVPAPNGKESTWRAVVVLENRGLMYFRPTGKFEIADEQGKVVETEDFQSFPVLPKREQWGLQYHVNVQPMERIFPADQASPLGWRSAGRRV
jgi:hypothetical protein